MESRGRPGGSPRLERSREAGGDDAGNTDAGRHHVSQGSAVTARGTSRARSGRPCCRPRRPRRRAGRRCRPGAARGGARRPGGSKPRSARPRPALTSARRRPTTRAASPRRTPAPPHPPHGARAGRAGAARGGRCGRAGRRAAQRAAEVDVDALARPVAPQLVAGGRRHTEAVRPRHVGRRRQQRALRPRDGRRRARHEGDVGDVRPVDEPGDVLAVGPHGPVGRLDAGELVHVAAAEIRRQRARKRGSLNSSS